MHPDTPYFSILLCLTPDDFTCQVESAATHLHYAQFFKILNIFNRFLGSVEVFEFTGNTVLCQAIATILRMRSNSKLSEIPPCSLEIDYRGIRLVDHGQENEVG